MLRAQLFEECDHEPAKLVAAFRVGFVPHLPEQELERPLVVAGLERREQLGPLAGGA